ncbi:hypothetical protein HMPREF1869_01171 [Bacteroidales bacterium KA00251]|nr:hypothetical protein HMPREF1869_01171 [Bacteroidales bacterium KA00251]
MNTLSRYNKYQEEVELEVAQTRLEYQNELAQLQGIIQEEGVFQVVRNQLVTRGSGLDKFLSLVGIKRSNNAPFYEKKHLSFPASTSFVERVKQLGVKAYDKAQDFLGDPYKRKLIWDFAKPIILTASLAFARNTLQRGVTGLFSLPFRLFRNSQKRG